MRDQLINKTVGDTPTISQADRVATSSASGTMNAKGKRNERLPRSLSPLTMVRRGRFEKDTHVCSDQINHVNHNLFSHTMSAGALPTTPTESSQLRAARQEEGGKKKAVPILFFVIFILLYFLRIRQPPGRHEDSFACIDGFLNPPPTNKTAPLPPRTTTHHNPSPFPPPLAPPQYLPTGKEGADRTLASLRFCNSR